MDSKLKRCRSLPPLVDGKVYGYVKLIIDKIVWLKRNPGNVLVLASWWGENNSLHFKPTDEKCKTVNTKSETEGLYVIKTNKPLFQEYIKNCESLELVIVLESSNVVIGSARVSNLTDIFKHRAFARYFPVLNPNKVRIGDIRVAIELSTSPLLSDPKNFQTKEITRKKERKSINPDENLNKMQLLSLNEYNSANVNDNILTCRDNKMQITSPIKKSNAEMTDKLVAQVIARAQRLRGIILKESQEDPLALSDSSFLENVRLGKRTNDANLHDLMQEKTFQSKVDPNFGADDIEHLIDVCLKTNGGQFDGFDALKTAKVNDFEAKSLEAVAIDERQPDDAEEMKKQSPVHYVDSLKVYVETLALSSAGYRRVRSSCMSRDERATMSTSFFVHYDPTFANAIDYKNKVSKEKKMTKIFSRKQYENVIHFNHSAIYNLPKSSLNTNTRLRFKVYHRHLNQRSPTELGTGCININDALTTKYLNTTQRVTVVNKGIKVGELKVTIELGCDGIHFGKEFIDAVVCEKENIPVIEHLSASNRDGFRYRITGTASKQNSGISTTQLGSITSSSVSESSSEKPDTVRRRNDKMMFQNCPSDNNFNDKVLLHGLIYIAEGKDLPSLNTYLICRAFWREDKAASGVCLNTDKPFYNFHQLVPIIHGQEFLERTKHNYIITEVHGKCTSGDNLIGVAKLPVHQLYVAYRDPLVLSHLTLSKYPVISVDGWVNVVDLVSGQHCGQILALVAVGTADQIALLEMTRGLRNSCVTPRTLQDCAHVMTANYNDLEEHPVLLSSQHHLTDKYPIETCRSQECQTEITTVEETKAREDCNTSDEVLSHTIDDQSARHCNQVQMEQAQRLNAPSNEKRLKPLQLSATRNNVLLSSDESSIDSPGENLPSAMFRSVGVGAEFNEETNMPAQFAVVQQQQVSSIEHSDVEEMSDTCGGSFKATVEIECAYHLPMVEKLHETVEPSTYVTFQSAMDSVNGRGSNVVTNVCLRTCTPKWDWKCSTRLSRELVNNKDKRLILKIWRLYDPDKHVQVDHEKDIVIGVAAIDLSVFLVGFPVLCGWFNIISYTGEIIGQIRVSITPLENLTNLNSNQFTNSNPVANYDSSMTSEDGDNCNQKSSEDFDIMPHFDTESISFLSHSLKQKLTELNEITTRLKSRLHDVTSNSFEDEFDDEFQLMDSDGENNAEIAEKSTNAADKMDLWSCGHEIKSTDSDHGIRHNLASCNPSFSLDSESNYLKRLNAPQYGGLYSSSSTSDPHNSRSNPDYLTKDMQAQKSSASSTATSEPYPVKGTKVHINHLLEKLSVQLGGNSKSPFPVQANVMDLLDSLRHSHESNTSPKIGPPTHAEKVSSNCSSECQTPPTATKMSTILREELVAEENEGATFEDHLSRHLMASNLRHIGNTENCSNPLFYEHLLPEVTNLVQISGEAQSPETDAVKQLDSRYVENFNLAMNSGLHRLYNLPNSSKDSQDKGSNADLEAFNFRLNPSGVSENAETAKTDLIPAPKSNDQFGVDDIETRSSSSSLDKTSVQTVLEDEDNVMTSSESSASIISRQAPDGGNPIEESSGLIVTNQNESGSN